jgi:hypothetical protein
VEELQQDGLGLLLQGTTVVDLCSQKAEETGWAIGDQIVEVSGQRVVSFEEFIERFKVAQEKQFHDGSPICLGVLRRESMGDADDDDDAEDALAKFFDEASMADLAKKLQRKFDVLSDGLQRKLDAGSVGDSNSGFRGLLARQNSGDSADEDETPAAAPPPPLPITENPYIQALRKRRSEHLFSVDGWASDGWPPSGEGGNSAEGGGSLASRLATQRIDAVATLSRSRPSPEMPQLFSSSCAPQCQEQMCISEIRPTPRLDVAAMEPCMGASREGAFWQMPHRCRSQAIDDESSLDAILHAVTKVSRAHSDATCAIATIVAAVPSPSRAVGNTQRHGQAISAARRLPRSNAVASDSFLIGLDAPVNAFNEEVMEVAVVPIPPAVADASRNFALHLLSSQ